MVEVKQDAAVGGSCYYTHLIVVMMVMLLFDDDDDFGHGINVDHNDDDDSDHNDKKGDDRKGCKVETKAGSEHLPRPHSWKKDVLKIIVVHEGHKVIVGRSDFHEGHRGHD